MKHSSPMRMVVVVALVAVQACGGKLWIEDVDGGTAPPTVADAAPPTPVAPDTSMLAKPTCAPPAMWTPDFGTIDVSRLGCECRAHEDCDPGEMCIEFPAVDYPRCAATNDPCALVTCRGHAACVVTPSVPAVPTCYR